MLSVIQHKAAGHFRKATNTTAKSSPKLIEWFGPDYDDRIDILVLDPDITAFVCLSNGYLTVVEGVKISRDLSESRRKVISDCAGELYDYNVFSVPAKSLVQDFVSWIFLKGMVNFF